MQGVQRYRQAFTGGDREDIRRNAEGKNVKLVNQEEYHSRLEICKQCQYLDYGTTCRLCGCLVQIKAKLAGAQCPYPYQPRW